MNGGFSKMKEVENINEYYLERMVDIIVEQALLVASEKFEVVEKSFTPNGEAITKVYTLEPYGASEKMREALKEKAIKAAQEQYAKPSVFGK